MSDTTDSTDEPNRLKIKRESGKKAGGASKRRTPASTHPWTQTRIVDRPPRTAPNANK